MSDIPDLTDLREQLTGLSKSIEYHGTVDNFYGILSESERDEFKRIWNTIDNLSRLLDTTI